MISLTFLIPLVFSLKSRNHLTQSQIKILSFKTKFKNVNVEESDVKIKKHSRALQK